MDETQQQKDMLQWKAPEHIVKKRGADWFLIVGIVAIALALSSLIYGNVLFAVLIVIATFALIIFVLRDPKKITFSLTPQGIFIDEKKYPYTVFDSFWILEEENTSRIILQSEQLFVHHITLPLEEISPEEVREYLLTFMPEEEIYEPLSHRIMEYLGF